MADPSSVEAHKRAAAYAAAAEIEPNMLVGLGTGSTAAYAISAVGKRLADGLVIRAVATSERTQAAAIAAGIAVEDFSKIDQIDLCIDGVDEIDPAFRAIKGAGGAMLREKIVASSASRVIAVADSSKQVVELGERPVPVEILPFARSSVYRQLTMMGGAPLLRLDVQGRPWRSDQNNFIIDCYFGLIGDPGRLASNLSGIAGVLGHDLFLEEIDALYVGSSAGVDRLCRRLPG